MKQNFNPEREREEQRGDELQFGATSQCIAQIPQSLRDEYLPIGETQKGREDFQDCASRSPVNVLEAKFTYAYQNLILTPDQRAWLESKGYVVNNRVTFSDRFVAILSGTTRNGNSLKAPLEAIRKQGLIPKAMLPKREDMSFDDYHDATAITDEMRELGKAFAARFTINYEQVHKAAFADALPFDFIGVAGYAWPAPRNGEYPAAPGFAFNHAFALYRNPRYYAFDNYEDWDATNTHQVAGDYTKKLAPDYEFFDWGYIVRLTSQNDVSQLISLKTRLLALLKTLLNLLLGPQKLPTPEPAPQPLPVPPVAPQPPKPPVVHPHGWAAGTLEERKAMFQLAVRVCQEEEVTEQMTRDLLLTIAGESGFNQWCENRQTYDYGLCQFSKRYYLKEYGMTPQEAIDQPERCVRIMARNFKAGRQSNWVAYSTRKQHANMLKLLS